MRDGSEILQSIKDIIGLEAYRMYPDSRRLIPDAVLWGVAAACATEFLKGAIDFKSIGEGAHNKLMELMRRFEHRDAFEEFVDAQDVESLAASAIAAAPIELTPDELTQARSNLEDALKRLGLSGPEIRNKVAEIEKAIYPPDEE